MYNRRVKFGQKIPNILGKMPENFRGGGNFLTHTVQDVLMLSDEVIHKMINGSKKKECDQ